MSQRILIIDDEPVLLGFLSRFLVAKGFTVATAADGTGGRALVRSFSPDLVLLDLHLPDDDGMDILAAIKRDNAGIAVVIVTAHGNVDTVVRAVQAQADHFVLKPVDAEVLLTIIRKVLESYHRRDQVAYLSDRLKAASVVQGSGSVLLPDDIAQEVGILAASGSTNILLLGETGTGKGVLARLLHDHSPRGENQFVDLNCAGLGGNLLETELFGHEPGAFTDARSRKRGLLEVGDGGTLFLDEIGAMPIEVQAKLLKVIEEKWFRRVGGTQTIRVDVRLIAATNGDLEAAARAGQFRADLLYRLNAVTLRLPPLRARPEHITPLALQFVAAFGQRKGVPGLRLSPEAEAMLQGYGWPGNIRELRNVVERAVILCSGDVIRARDLPELLAARPRESPADWGEEGTLARVEERHIRRVLESVGRSRTAAARILGIHRSTLIAKMKRFRPTE